MGIAARPAIEPAPAREYGLDALRVFAFLVLILYHSGMAFVSWDWHLKNPEKSTALEYVMLFANRWRLPLLFFISGAGVAFSLRRRSFREFAGERIGRLLVPLAVGMLVIVPPQIYLERLHQGVQFESYAAFYRTVFEFVPYPQGSTSWHHLWFLAYVLVFALASIPLFALLRRRAGKEALGAFAGWIERSPAAIYLVTVPNLMVAIYLGPRWPTTHNLVADWANLTGTWLTFLWGFVFASNRRLLDVVTRRRREFLYAGIAVAAVFFALRASGAARAWTSEMRNVVSNIISGYFGLTWIFALIGYARAKIRTGSPALRYATEAVYPFYIVHQTITVALVYWAMDWAAGVWLKLPVVAAGTFLGSWLFFECARRIGPLRPLFGLKLHPAHR
jgi:surface polysaccharide O-acyltransferase-like enzyme